MHGFWLWLICVLVQRRPAGRRGGQAWLRARALRRAGQVTNRALGDTTLKHAIRRHAQVGRCAKAGEGLAPARPIATAAKIVPQQERGPGAGLACRVLPVLQYIISFTCSSDFLARHPTGREEDTSFGPFARRPTHLSHRRSLLLVHIITQITGTSCRNR